MNVADVRGRVIRAVQMALTGARGAVEASAVQLPAAKPFGLHNVLVSQ
jgi:hypothetical protein